MRDKVRMLFSIGLLAVAGCDGSGFSLPPGNPDAGKLVFTRMQCNSCHSLPGIEQQPVVDGQTISVELGGEVAYIKTYGELVTSVINPSHRIAQSYAPYNTDEENRSPMTNYNDVMTVTELVDLVSFLESHYTVRPYEPSRYRVYHP